LTERSLADAGAQDPVRNVASSRLGKAVEYLVAATCILSSRAELNVSTALVDDEGVDLVFHRRDGTATLAVQVKSRSIDTVPLVSGTMQAFIREQTFKPRPDLYLLFVAVDVTGGSFEMCWLVPSLAIAEKLRANARRRLVFSASMKPGARDRWSPYRISRQELAVRVQGELDLLDQGSRQGGATGC
jgi:hypothetical protein